MKDFTKKLFKNSTFLSFVLIVYIWTWIIVLYSAGAHPQEPQGWTMFWHRKVCELIFYSGRHAYRYERDVISCSASRENFLGVISYFSIALLTLLIVSIIWYWFHHKKVGNTQPKA